MMLVCHDKYKLGINELSNALDAYNATNVIQMDQEPHEVILLAKQLID